MYIVLIVIYTALGYNQISSPNFRNRLILFQLLDEKGIQFHSETSASEFVGSGGKIKEVVLLNGTKLPADLCITGVGEYTTFFPDLD